MQNPSNICPRCRTPIPADAPGGLCPACVLLGVAGPTNPSQAAAASAPTIDEIAAAFPELEILELIGQGGMGVVFKARQPRLDRIVALKILPPALAAQPGFAERFTREARVLAKLAHPNIVAIYDFGETAGFFFLVMEFVRGVNLRAAMRAGVTPEQALLLVPRICDALQFAHDHGVLHRDIKPENILLDTTGAPKLADFGIAKLAGEEALKTGLTATGAALGTAAYMAPEQVEKPATVDHRADIYSLGVVFYEMLTGELPLGRFGAPSEKSPVNRGVDEVVMRALEKERERRQQSATAMKTEVEHASHQSARPAFAPRSVFEDAPITRILVALTLLSGVGIPNLGMLSGWPNPPRYMVPATIALGVLALLSKSFFPAQSGSAKRVAANEPPFPELIRKGHKLARIGLGLMLVPLVAILLAIPWLWKTILDARDHGGPNPGEILRQHPAVVLAIGIPMGLAAVGGVLATLAALFGFRYRAPWFFTFVFLITSAALLIFGKGMGMDTVTLLCIGIIGYCIYFFREFFPQNATVPSSAAAVSPSAAWNPWPRRIFLLILALVLLPTVLIGIGILVPILAFRTPPQPPRTALNSGLLPLEIGAERKREIVSIQNEAIRIAGERLRIAKGHVENGTKTAIEQKAAERDLAIAEARGDAVKIGEAKVAFEEARLAILKAGAQADDVSAAVVLESEQALNNARQEVQNARAARAEARDDTPHP